MHRLDVGSSFMAAGTAFAWGVARHRARRQAYVEAVVEARNREAMQRRIRRLEAALTNQQKQAEAAEVDRRLQGFLRNLRG